MPSDQVLQDAYGRMLKSRSLDGRRGCVSAEDDLLSLVEKTGSEEDRLRTLDHVMSCPACRRDFELLRALTDGFAGLGGSSSRRTRWLTGSGLSWAASLVLMVGAGSLYWSIGRPGPDGVMRGVDTQVGLIAPVAGAAPSEGMTFVWHSLPEGFDYTLELFGEGGDVVLSASTPDTTFTLETGLPEGVEATRWWVTARTGNGTVVTSEIRPLRLSSR